MRLGTRSGEMGVDHKYTCNLCGREDELVRLVSEEVPLPINAKLTRKPKFGWIQRTFEVRCPVHGVRHVLKEGHHVSTLPKRRAT